MANYQIHTLSNGLRLVHQQINGDSVVGHLGLIINTGSRDELKKENGLAHFIEHLIFKGTKKRKAYHVLSRLEDVGAEINAYTSKEETVIQAAFLRQDYERSLELMADIMINSI
ncbi:MAG: peptidase M16, partial [Bacteroidetes bacterium 4572_77]